MPHLPEQKPVAPEMDARKAVIDGLAAAIRDPECPIQFSPLLMEARQLLVRLAVSLPVVQADQWQDIGTAPKDGSEFLGVEKGKRWVVRWDKRFDQWVSLPGAYAMRPTQWQPLSALPTTHQSEGK